MKFKPFFFDREFFNNSKSQQYRLTQLFEIIYFHINPSIFHLINSGFQKKYFIFMPSYKAKMVVMWKKKNVYNEFTIPIFMNLLN